jgi:rod shape-determining protein MreD
MQQRNIIWLSLILLFFFETTIFHWIIPLGWKENIHITPHFVLTIILFIALYAHRHFALLLGLVFGLLHDIVFYGFMIGPYAFGMGLMGYLTGFIFNRSNVNFLSAIPIIMLSSFCFDLIIFGIYRLFGLIELSIAWIFLHQILPSLLFNLLFALMIYIPIRYLIDKMESNREEKENYEQ